MSDERSRQDELPQLSEDDRAHHLDHVHKMAQARQAQARALQVQAAWELWSEYLAGKYGFTDGHVVDEQGEVRSAAPSSSSSSP
jgi:hypothetical protein